MKFCNDLDELKDFYLTLLCWPVYNHTRLKIFIIDLIQYIQHRYTDTVSGISIPTECEFAFDLKNESSSKAHKFNVLESEMNNWATNKSLAQWVTLALSNPAIIEKLNRWSLAHFKRWGIKNLLKQTADDILQIDNTFLEKFKQTSQSAQTDEPMLRIMEKFFNGEKPKIYRCNIIKYPRNIRDEWSLKSLLEKYKNNFSEFFNLLPQKKQNDLMKETATLKPYLDYPPERFAHLKYLCNTPILSKLLDDTTWLQEMTCHFGGLKSLKDFLLAHNHSQSYANLLEDLDSLQREFHYLQNFPGHIQSLLDLLKQDLPEEKLEQLIEKIDFNPGGFCLTLLEGFQRAGLGQSPALIKKLYLEKDALKKEFLCCFSDSYDSYDSKPEVKRLRRLYFALQQTSKALLLECLADPDLISQMLSNSSVIFFKTLLPLLQTDRLEIDCIHIIKDKIPLLQKMLKQASFDYYFTVLDSIEPQFPDVYEALCAESGGIKYLVKNQEDLQSVAVIIGNPRQKNLHWIYNQLEFEYRGIWSSLDKLEFQAVLSNLKKIDPQLCKDFLNHTHWDWVTTMIKDRFDFCDILSSLNKVSPEHAIDFLNHTHWNWVTTMIKNRFDFCDILSNLKEVSPEHAIDFLNHTHWDWVTTMIKNTSDFCDILSNLKEVSPEHAIDFFNHIDWDWMKKTVANQKYFYKILSDLKEIGPRHARAFLNQTNWNWVKQTVTNQNDFCKILSDLKEVSHEHAIDFLDHNNLDWVKILVATPDDFCNLLSSIQDISPRHARNFFYCYQWEDMRLWVTNERFMSTLQNIDPQLAKALVEDNYWMPTFSSPEKDISEIFLRITDINQAVAVSLINECPKEKAVACIEKLSEKQLLNFTLMLPMLSKERYAYLTPHIHTKLQSLSEPSHAEVSSSQVTYAQWIKDQIKAQLPERLKQNAGCPNALLRDLKAIYENVYQTIPIVGQILKKLDDYIFRVGGSAGQRHNYSAGFWVKKSIRSAHRKINYHLALALKDDILTKTVGAFSNLDPLFSQQSISSIRQDICLSHNIPSDEQSLNHIGSKELRTIIMLARESLQHKPSPTSATGDRAFYGPLSSPSI